MIEERSGWYGTAPEDLGLIDLSPTEMMYWLYCPIKLPRGDLTVPANLRQFRPVVARVRQNLSQWAWDESYVYLTAKTLWVSQTEPGNRPGWHSDGFMTDDVNYVWSDSEGTLFWEPEELCMFSQDHVASLPEMEREAEGGPHKTYPDKHLLKLDERVIHRVPDFAEPRIRSFVKVSVSRHRYPLIGNSINHELNCDWDQVERAEDRNCPTGGTQ
ncbi:hypothetical protein QMT40_001829 [Parvibaculaceae bacterium PLY_AMNH_Bact1]|nr:hypothetical protein QMT40_001829 [Parvibaculaceae bacterium PLY_AMNH_Bact1]